MDLTFRQGIELLWWHLVHTDLVERYHYNVRLGLEPKYAFEATKKGY